MKASYHGHLDVAKTLVVAGATVNQTDKVGICRSFHYTVIYMYVSALAFCIPSVQQACIHTCICTHVYYAHVYVIIIPNAWAYNSLSIVASWYRPSSSHY